MTMLMMNWVRGSRSSLRTVTPSANQPMWIGIQMVFMIASLINVSVVRLEGQKAKPLKKAC